jgi:hypothetical protein
MNAEAMDKLWIVLSAETGREPGDPVELARLELLARCFPQDAMRTTSSMPAKRASLTRARANADVPARSSGQ